MSRQAHIEYSSTDDGSTGTMTVTATVEDTGGLRGYEESSFALDLVESMMANYGARLIQLLAQQVSADEFLVGVADTHVALLDSIGIVCPCEECAKSRVRNQSITGEEVLN